MCVSEWGVDGAADSFQLSDIIVHVQQCFTHNCIVSPSQLDNKRWAGYTQFIVIPSTALFLLKASERKRSNMAQIKTDLHFVDL